MIKAVIFDMDGVIINSEVLWDEAMSEVLARYGAKYTHELKLICMGKSLEETVEIKKKACNLNVDSKKLADEKLSAVLDRYEKHLEFMPGFQVLFEQLKLRKVRMCIATASDRTLMNAVDKKLNLTDLFYGNVVVKTSNHKSKPSPDLFLDAANKLNVKPEECVVIEDSPNGVEAALSAGMKCIALTGSTTSDKLQKADLIVNSLEEINHNVIGILGLI